LAGNISPHYPKLSPSMFAFVEYSNFLETVSGFFVLFNWKSLSIVFFFSCFVYGLHNVPIFERSSSFVSCFYLSWSIFFCLLNMCGIFFSLSCFFHFHFLGKRRPRSFYSHFPPHDPFFSESGWFSVTTEIVCVSTFFFLSLSFNY
jgi:hypothetical protein